MCVRIDYPACERAPSVRTHSLEAHTLDGVLHVGMLRGPVVDGYEEGVATESGNNDGARLHTKSSYKAPQPVLRNRHRHALPQRWLADMARVRRVCQKVITGRHAAAAGAKCTASADMRERSRQCVAVREQLMFLPVSNFSTSTRYFGTLVLLFTKPGRDGPAISRRAAQTLQGAISRADPTTTASHTPK